MCDTPGAAALGNEHHRVEVKDVGKRTRQVTWAPSLSERDMERPGALLRPAPADIDYLKRGSIYAFSRLEAFSHRETASEP